jgi:menaquinone-dependent protoporphyrinogen oxidase
MRILVLYASEHGQTAAIARAIADRLGAAGHRVDVVDSRAALPAPDDYGAIVLGSRVQIDRTARRIRRYARRHAEVLSARPTAVFAVSMNETAPGGGQRYVDGLVRQIGWTPRWTASFAGALRYTQYGVLVRWLMKRFSARNDGPIDTGRDHEQTDWTAVAGWADRIAAELAAA